MATTAFTAFLPEVLPNLPACSDIVAVNALRNACIDFCAGSMFWNATMDAETVTASDFPWSFITPPEATVASVMAVSLDGRPLAPVFQDALESRSDWATQTSTLPTSYYQPTPDTLCLYPILDGTGSMILRCAFKPTRSAASVESMIYQEYLEEIAAGAMAKLMKQPGQPWSNPELGLYHEGVFERAISDAAARVNKSFSRASTMIAMVPF